MGGKVSLKEGVVPHKFDCQGRLAQVSENRLRVARKRKIQEILQDKENILGEYVQWLFLTKTYENDTNILCLWIRTIFSTSIKHLPQSSDRMYSFINKFCARGHYSKVLLYSYTFLQSYKQQYQIAQKKYSIPLPSM